MISGVLVTCDASRLVFQNRILGSWTLFGVRKHVFSVPCSEFMFGFEHCLNTLSEHVTQIQKGGGASAPRPFLYTKKCSLGVFKQCSDANMNSEHWTMNRCFPNTEQSWALDISSRTNKKPSFELQGCRDRNWNNSRSRKCRKQNPRTSSEPLW